MSEGILKRDPSFSAVFPSARILQLTVFRVKARMEAKEAAGGRTD
jgi:hypothetical protein